MDFPASNAWDSGERVPGSPGKLTAPDPSQTGNYEVSTLIYGSGTDIKRPEYGKDVDIKTKTVDASVMLKVDKGFKAKTRAWNWEFDVKKFPVNDRLWYPKGGGSSGPCCRPESTAPLYR
jgi:hypothetical protein